MVWRYRTDLPWRDLPGELGPFRTGRKRLIRWAVEGMWEKILAAVLAAADAVDDIGWTVSAGSTVVRARGEDDAVVVGCQEVGHHDHVHR
jgi:transposase